MALLVVFVWGIATARPFLVPLCISALLAFLITPLVNQLIRWRLPEWLAVAVGSLAMLAPVVGVAYLLVLQGQNLVEDFPSIMKSVQEGAANFSQSGIGRKLGLNQGGSFSLPALLAKISSSAGQGIAIVVGGLSAIFSATSQLALILFYSVLMVASRKHLRGASEKIIAQSRTIHARALITELTSLIQRFLIAKMLIVLIVSVASAIVLKTFDVRYAFLLAIWNGITLTLIPAIGFLFGAVPTMIVALASGESLLSTLAIFGALFGLNLIEGNVLTPKLIGGRLNINALASFIGLLAGGLLWGIWGMFLSIPILGVLRICFSAFPSLQPWGELMADREDKRLSLSLTRKTPSQDRAA
jgi:predicted PurR-regulated permease PerM